MAVPLRRTARLGQSSAELGIAEYFHLLHRQNIVTAKGPTNHSNRAKKVE